jgi:aminodeoxyfutalosine deaminase
MIKKISADWIFPISAAPIPNGVVIIDTNEKKIVGISTQKNDFERTEIEFYKGIICPAFVNTHCHLELSHLLGKVATGTGLLDFIGHVVANRAASAEVIQSAIAQADAQMYAYGIEAVGDICNVIDTFEVKNNSNMRYYNFVECFDFWQNGLTVSEFQKYKSVYSALKPKKGDNKSFVPHAPYSVSPAMFGLINQIQPDKNVTVSVHNQETIAENNLFINKKSTLVDMWKRFGFHYDDLEALGKGSIYYLLQHLNPTQRNLFVHNTLTTSADIAAAHSILPRCYWATCPNANLYIENKLPNYKDFISENACVTIGTDSLTSNWSLSVLDELKTIAKYQSYINTETVLKWATLNGALALGYENDLGSIEIGKHCGLINLNLNEDLKITDNTAVNRIM